MFGRFDAINISSCINRENLSQCSLALCKSIESKKWTLRTNNQFAKGKSRTSAKDKMHVLLLLTLARGIFTTFSHFYAFFCLLVGYLFSCTLQIPLLYVYIYHQNSRVFRFLAPFVGMRLQRLSTLSAFTIIYRIEKCDAVDRQTSKAHHARIHPKHSASFSVDIFILIFYFLFPSMLRPAFSLATIRFWTSWRVYITHKHKYTIGSQTNNKITWGTYRGMKTGLHWLVLFIVKFFYV